MFGYSVYTHTHIHSLMLRMSFSSPLPVLFFSFYFSLHLLHSFPLLTNPLHAFSLTNVSLSLRIYLQHTHLSFSSSSSSVTFAFCARRSLRHSIKVYLLTSPFHSHLTSSLIFSFSPLPFCWRAVSCHLLFQLLPFFSVLPLVPCVTSSLSVKKMSRQTQSVGMERFYPSSDPRIVCHRSDLLWSPDQSDSWSVCCSSSALLDRISFVPRGCTFHLTSYHFFF